MFISLLEKLRRTLSLREREKVGMLTHSKNFICGRVGEIWWLRFVFYMLYNRKEFFYLLLSKSDLMDICFGNCELKISTAI